MKLVNYSMIVQFTRDISIGIGTPKPMHTTSDAYTQSKHNCGIYVILDYICV